MESITGLPFFRRQFLGGDFDLCLRALLFPLLDLVPVDGYLNAQEPFSCGDSAFGARMSNGEIFPWCIPLKTVEMATVVSRNSLL